MVLVWATRSRDLRRVYGYNVLSGDGSTGTIDMNKGSTELPTSTYWPRSGVADTLMGSSAA